MTLEGQMEGVQHNFMVCLLLKKPRPVALGVQSHLHSTAGLPFHWPPFGTTRQFCTQNTGQRPCLSLVVCALKPACASPSAWTSLSPFPLGEMLPAYQGEAQMFLFVPSLILLSSYKLYCFCLHNTEAL